MTLLPPLVLLVALIPGAFAWWTGRRLSRQVDDPALPELLFARRQRLISALATCLVLTVAIGRRHAWWGLPVLVLASLVGQYPLRSRLRPERAGFRGYLWFSLRSLAGGFGFWVTLLLAPTLVNTFGIAGWPASVALALLLLLWEYAYIPLWLRLHDAAPLADAEVRPRIDEIVKKAGTMQPSVYQIGGEARFVNALALPSLRRPSVAMGSGLLELLDPDESAAIFAHELAHLEHHPPRMLRRHQLGNRVLIVLGVGVPLAALASGAPDVATWTAIVWPVIALLALARRVARRQKEETESDLRAAQLCGDPELLIRALVKVHVHAFIPRRWSVDFERGASHPSLTRRIQALRGTAATPPSLGAPVVLPTARAGTVVAFDDGHIYTFDGVADDVAREIDALRAAASGYRAAQYADLTELRVAVTGDGRALRARHRNGDAWSLPLAAGQVAAVQHALDVVDVRLHRDLGRRPSTTGPLVAIAILIATVLAGEFGVLFVPLALALMRPSAAVNAALGTMAVVRAGLSGLDLEANAWTPYRGIALIALALLGALAIRAAVRDRKADDARDGTKLTVGVLGATTVLALVWLIAQLGAMSLGSLGEEAALATIAVTLAGISGALLLRVRKPNRAGGLATGVLALAATTIVALASPRLHRGPALATQQARATVIADLPLDNSTSGLRLSPDGHHYLLRRFIAAPRRRERLAPSLVISDIDGRQRDVDAIDAAFVPDGRLLVLRDLGDSLELRLESPDGETAFVADTLPDMADAVLRATPFDSTWTVAGTVSGTDDVAVWSGIVGRRGARSRTIGAIDSGIEGLLIFDGGARVMFRSFARPTSTLSGVLTAFGARSELWEVDSTGFRRVAAFRQYPDCGIPAHGVASCAVLGGASELWIVREIGTATQVARFRGLAHSGRRLVPGPGGTAIVPIDETHIEIVDGAANAATRVTLPGGSGFVSDAAAVPGLLGVLHYGKGARLTLYRFEPTGAR